MKEFQSKGYFTFESGEKSTEIDPKKAKQRAKLEDVAEDKKEEAQDKKEEAPP